MPVSKNGKRYYTTEQLDIAKQASALEYALASGYQLKQEGNIYRHPDHDSMVFKTDGRWYWNSQDRSGRALDFVIEFEQRDYTEAVCLLAGEDIGQTTIRTYEPKQKSEPKKEFCLPEKNETHNRVFAYLTKTRGLDSSLVRRLLQLGIVYEDKKYHNAVFVQRDPIGKAGGAFLRGTNTFSEKGFKGAPESSDKVNCSFYFGNTKNFTRVEVFESSIDSISKATMMQNSSNAEEKAKLGKTVFLSSDGNGHDNVMKFLTAFQEQIEEVYLCHDNDIGGHKQADSLKNSMEQEGFHFIIERDLPVHNDFNQDLTDMKQKLLIFFLSFCLLFTISPLPVLGAEGNMDGEGGGMDETGGNGDSNGQGNSGWNEGNEGIRVSVVEKSSNQTVGISFDWSNVNWNGQSPIHFGKTTKLEYQAGAVLTPIFSGYSAKQPTAKIPPIISSSGATNIAEVKRYFTDEKTVKDIANYINLDYEHLISGDFTIVLEPIAYFSYNGNRFAMTATEAALYDIVVGKSLRSTMGYLTHQNLPLAMYLEKDELSIFAFGGGGGLKNNDLIIKQLGIGTVNFDEESGSQIGGGGNDDDDDEEPEEEEYDFEYRTDTDVITTIKICTNRDITPDSVGRASFTLPNGIVRKEYVIPTGECQLVWIKWHTPEEEGIVEIPVTITGGNTEKAIIKAKIVKVSENIPPDPRGRDRKDDFAVPTPPTAEQVTSLSWIEWWAKWVPDWEWEDGNCNQYCPDDCDDEHGEWVDNGKWEFEHRVYDASLDIRARIVPDSRAVTASSSEMKSGYGFNAEITSVMRTNAGADNVTELQYVSATFPEFGYETYNRLLEQENGTTWAFKENEFSQFNNRVHFTPVWYPDGTTYVVAFTVLDAWTPAGQLYYVVTADDITINANVFDDWHTAPTN